MRGKSQIMGDIELMIDIGVEECVDVVPEQGRSQSSRVTWSSRIAGKRDCAARKNSW